MRERGTFTRDERDWAVGLARAACVPSTDLTCFCRGPARAAGERQAKAPIAAMARTSDRRSERRMGRYDRGMPGCLASATPGREPSGLGDLAPCFTRAARQTEPSWRDGWP